MDEQQRTNVQSIIDELDGIGDLIGGWETKSDNRQTGVSLYIHFDKKVDVTVSMRFTEVIQNCPGMLNDACQKLLANDAEIKRLRKALSKAGSRITRLEDGAYGPPSMWIQDLLAE